MNLSRRFQNPMLFGWMAILAVSLICAQNLRFHIHDLDHSHVGDHEHPSSIHLSIDKTHADHHDELAYEIDSLHDNFILNSSIQLPSSELLFLFALILLSMVSYRHVGRKSRIYVSALRRRLYFAPQLRAPPR